MKNDQKWIGKEVRVRFDLEVNDGFPPISAEFLIGTLEKEGIVCLDNTPFFVEGVAFGDRIFCNGLPPNMEFESLQEESGYRAVSVIFVDCHYEDELYKLLKFDGCYTEFGEFPEYDMLAVAIPPDLDYDKIKDLLEHSEQSGKISFAELCVH